MKSEEYVYITETDKKRDKVPKLKIGDLIRTAHKRDNFQKVKQQIGVRKGIQLEELLMIQNQLTVVTISFGK